MREVISRPEVQAKRLEYCRSDGFSLKRPDVQAKAHATKKKQGYPMLTGGNGRGLTEPQQLLLERLPGWKPECAIGVNPWQKGYPRNFKVDIALPSAMLAVELDGQSHLSVSRKAQDRRKEEYLHSRGWTVLRFRNEAVTSDPEAIATVILKAAGSTT
jgi:hypothetical protein